MAGPGSRLPVGRGRVSDAMPRRCPARRPARLPGLLPGESDRPSRPAAGRRARRGPGASVSVFSLCPRQTSRDRRPGRRQSGAGRGPATSFASSAPRQKVTEQLPKHGVCSERLEAKTAQAQEFTCGGWRGGGAGRWVPIKQHLASNPAGSGLQIQSDVAAGPQTPGTKRHRI